MIAVLVTTDADRRGVFFGYVPDELDFQEVIRTGIVPLKGMRNCIFWKRSVGGVFGLVESGPNADCKIGRKTNQTCYLNGVTFIAEVTEAARLAWEVAPCVS